MIEGFGGAIVDGSNFTYPAGAEVWAGFANLNTISIRLPLPMAVRLPLQQQSQRAAVIPVSTLDLSVCLIQMSTLPLISIQ